MSQLPHDGGATPENPSRYQQVSGALKGGRSVTFVVADDNESFDSLLRRFKKRVQGDRILSEIRKRRYFEQPSVVRKRKRAAKLRKSRRTTMKDLRRTY
ncbi:MAG: 30S ribosomal protein S21 [Chloroflexi bacterium]|nr:30S ribosomal protein S21 [Chloroflexota bacterium]